MPLGSAERSVAPSVSVVRSSPTRSAAKGHAQKNNLICKIIFQTQPQKRG
ncbi:MAG: hypothetical protein NZ455_12250 [Bacteroidia bacterium]|nr:hypothetical protein [Bacteroidia bacterium]MDW8345556.1 hypothetical protein [Bacteroidia bacterium]